jgi:hypothetical protein
MTLPSLETREKKFSILGIAFGLLVSGLLAPKDGFFLPNFGFYWGSQLAVLAMILLLRPRAAVIAAISVVLAALLLGFHTWLAIRASQKPDGLVWLLYVVLLIGAAIGGLGITWWLRTRNHFTSFQTACISAIGTIAGIVIAGIVAI